MSDDLNPQFVSGMKIPAHEASVAVQSLASGKQNFVYGKKANAPTSPEPTVAVFRMAPRRAEGQPDAMVNIVTEVTNGLKRGHTTLQLSREAALALMKEMVKALEIAPYELSEL